MRWWMLLFSVWISVWLAPVAQAAPSQTLTIPQAVQEALDNNLTLVAERYNISLAEAHIVTARLRPNPVLTLNASFPDHTIFHSNVNPYSEVAHLDWVFERGGKREARKNRQKVYG
jgi:outer membrane protein, heavy metal efflux system